MRSVRHWKPRYLFDRLAEFCYRRAAPDAPWLTPPANTLLDQYLQQSHVALEFGSGKSTFWLARRVSELTSVENESLWYAKVGGQLRRRGVQNVRYLFATREEDYLRIIDGFSDHSLDLVLIDGAWREQCANRVLTKLRRGGMLVLDNVNWYLPSDSRSPNSRRPDQGADGPGWQAFAAAVQDWRRIWTSSGVFDTALYFKPSSD